MGSTRTQTTNTPILGQEDLDFLGQIIGQNTGAGAGEAFSSYYNRSPDMMYEDFLKRVRDPALQNFHQNIVPEIQQTFGNLSASSSSALNQALGQSGRDLSTSLNTSFLDYYNKERDRGLTALRGLVDIARTPKFTPTITTKKGPWESIGKIGSDLIRAPFLEWILKRYFEKKDKKKEKKAAQNNEQ